MYEQSCQKLVSVVMAYNNRKSQLEATIRSINLSQYVNVEIVVVDDASSEEHRIEDLVKLSKYPMKVIRIEAKDKDWINPCVPFNIGFKNCSGSIILIQNPECIHCGDIITNAACRSVDGQYFTYTTFGIDDYGICEKIRKEIEYHDKYEDLANSVAVYFRNDKPSSNSVFNWYNHVSFRPSNYHFCSVITKGDLNKLKGFDERFAFGIAYDDDEFLTRINKNKILVKTITDSSLFCLHQFHGGRIDDSNFLLKSKKNNEIFKNLTCSMRTYTISNEVSENYIRKHPILVNEVKSVDGSENAFSNGVPKIAHFYWGAKTLPFLRYMTLLSFRKLHPDWTMILYTPETLQARPTWKTAEQKYTVSTSENYISKLKDIDVKVVSFDMRKIGHNNNLSEVIKSDLIRWHLLSTIGGLWSDMDIIYTKNIKCANLDNQANIFICCHDFHSIGFMIGNQNNKFYEVLLAGAKNRLNTNEYQSAGSSLMAKIYGENFKAVKSATFALVGDSVKLENIPFSVVYPIPDINVICGQHWSNSIKLMKDTTIGLHWYAGHNLLAQQINTINERNCLNGYNILSYLCKNIMEMK